MIFFGEDKEGLEPGEGVPPEADRRGAEKFLCGGISPATPVRSTAGRYSPPRADPPLVENRTMIMDIKEKSAAVDNKGYISAIFLASASVFYYDGVLMCTILVVPILGGHQRYSINI